MQNHGLYRAELGRGHHERPGFLATGSFLETYPVGRNRAVHGLKLTGTVIGVYEILKTFLVSLKPRRPLFRYLYVNG